MSELAHIVNKNGVTIFIEGKPVKVGVENPNYKEVLTALNNKVPVEELQEIINRHIEAEKHGFDVDEGKYNGQPLHPVLVEKLLRLEKEGYPMAGLVEFCLNLSMNPRSSSVEELFDFLSYKELPITEDGCFIAYKGVGTDDFSLKGNKQTVVLQGEVDDTGRIKNVKGATIEVLPSSVDDDRSQGCSYGLHVGSLDYARDWGRNGKVYVVKVNPKDVVSVPTDCSCQKCRVSKYDVLDELEFEIIAPLVSADGSNAEGIGTEWNEIVQAVYTYLSEVEDEGFSSVTLEKTLEVVNNNLDEPVSKDELEYALNQLVEANNWRYDDWSVYLDPEEDEDWDDDDDDDVYGYDNYWDEDDDDEDDDYDDDIKPHADDDAILEAVGSFSHMSRFPISKVVSCLHDEYEIDHSDITDVLESEGILYFEDTVINFVGNEDKYLVQEAVQKAKRSGDYSFDNIKTGDKVIDGMIKYYLNELGIPYNEQGLIVEDEGVTLNKIVRKVIQNNAGVETTKVDEFMKQVHVFDPNATWEQVQEVIEVPFEVVESFFGNKIKFGV